MTKFNQKQRIDKITRIIGKCQSILEIKDAVALYGYHGRKFEEGEALIKEYQRCRDAQKRHYESYHQGVEDLHRYRNYAKQTYWAHIQLARLILKGNKELTVPRQCKKRQSTDLKKWLSDARNFYAIVLCTSWLERFKHFNVSEEKLLDGKRKIEAVNLANDTKDILFKEAMQSTSLRDETLQELEKWCTALVTVAKIALGKNNPLLNELK